MITGKTIPYGLFGYPVKHTFSPQMHNYVFNELIINGVYIPLEVKPENLEMSLKSLIWLGFGGVNITVPHKQTCMQYLDNIDEEAKLIGAVNTIKVSAEKLIGYNTDGLGFVNSLKENQVDLKGLNVLILGAGGASRAISISMVRNNDVGKIYIYDIESSKSQNLVKDLNVVKDDIAINVQKQSLENAIDKVDVLINATPIGLREEDIPIDSKLIKPHLKLVYDLIYNPSETKLLKIAKKQGIKKLNGIGMLVNQGAISFKIWTEIEKPPVDIMYKAISTYNMNIN